MGSLPGKEERKEGMDGGSPGLAQYNISTSLVLPPPTIWHLPCLLPLPGKFPLITILI